MQEIAYDVRIRSIEKRKNAQGAVISYRLSWNVDGEVWKETFKTAAQADAFRSELMTAARRGEPFSVSTGRPTSWQREVEQPEPMRWYAFTLRYVEAKWLYASPNHRRGIAEALTDATEALLTDAHPFPREAIRAALRWSYSNRVRDTTEPPPEFVDIVRWLESHTTPLAALTEHGSGAVLTRHVLARISQTKQGKPAAANTSNRKRMVLNNAMEYAQEIGELSSNPLKAVKWAKQRTLTTVDPRVVINISQARRFLKAVENHSERGRRMKAFFGCMYFAALRPEEVVDLRQEHLVSLPADDWGEMRLTNAEPRSGSRWTNSGKVRERRELKHRAVGEIRRVPIHPELSNMLIEHLKEFGAGPGGRIFIGPRGGLMTDRAYLKVFHEARARGFTPSEARSPLMEVPYALRHAAVSTWLNAGVPAPQVAEWAGHSVDVLLRVYAKCIYGQQDEAMRRIFKATR
ncbi:integrase [Nonomuraea sp. KC401]|uniref:tyrosine-type recombinase/integrase n=1 Tax=unclassified Nonomuraea TaxID=2593643 RepID=UPI0010FCE00D|nr:MULTISPECIES: tyrosine-type recombinase/integrase [unclassified Nonomuraea]NBE95500.1 tyrosine-type recombinase/integrase [Nonomuraea sp. K271]TLF70983.1 integrase [Nonomuraea sp. KC401]